MQESRKDDEPRPVHYTYPGGSRYLSRRDDEQGDSWRSTIDLTASGWAPNPLSGPSTNRAEAIEVRALTMIADLSSSSEKAMRQRTERLGQNVQKRLRNWMASINGTIKQRKEGATTNLKAQDSINDKSDRSLVVVRVKDNKDGFRSTSPAPHGSAHQLRDQFPTPGQHAEPFATETIGYRAIQFPRLPEVYFENEVHSLATSDAVTSQEELTSADPNQHMVREHAHAQTSSNSQQVRTDFAANFLPDDQISLFELPPPLYELYERPEYQNWSLNSGFIAPATHMEETNSVALAEDAILAAGTLASPYLEVSRYMTSDWRNAEHDDSFLGALSPPASLIVENNSFMKEPEDLSPIQNSPAPSRRNSDALSVSELTTSEHSLPPIYPRIEQYPPPANCTEEINENWSNTSRSIFGSDPQYYHRVVALPVHLRGGGQEKNPQNCRGWRLFLGKLPVGDVGKGKILLDSPVSKMDNFLLGRRGKPKTSKELVEEAERRIEKGKEEIQKCGEKKA